MIGLMRQELESAVDLSPEQISEILWPCVSMNEIQDAIFGRPLYACGRAVGGFYGWMLRCALMAVARQLGAESYEPGRN